MSLSWSLPRVFVATPVWRVRTDFSLAPAKLRPVQRPKAKHVARAAPAALDQPPPARWSMPAICR